MWKYLKSWWAKPHWYHKETVDMASRFGQFFLERHGGDYAQAEAEIDRMKITEVKLIKDRFHVTLKRPGLLIGRKGILVDSLAEYLGVKLHIIEAPSSAVDYLCPQNYDL